MLLYSSISQHLFSLCLCFLPHLLLHFFPLFSTLSSFQYAIIIIYRELNFLQLSSLLFPVLLLLLHLSLTVSKTFVTEFLDFLHDFYSYFTVLYQKGNLVIFLRDFSSNTFANLVRTRILNILKDLWWNYCLIHPHKNHPIKVERAGKVWTEVSSTKLASQT